MQVHGPHSSQNQQCSTPTQDANYFSIIKDKYIFCTETRIGRILFYRPVVHISEMCILLVFWFLLIYFKNTIFGIIMPLNFFFCRILHTGHFFCTDNYSYSFQDRIFFICRSIVHTSISEMYTFLWFWVLITYARNTCCWTPLFCKILHIKYLLYI